jgi:hypothetical protein
MMAPATRTGPGLVLPPDSNGRRHRHTGNHHPQRSDPATCRDLRTGLVAITANWRTIPPYHPSLGSTFRTLPEPGHHPAFRITSTTSQGTDVG